MIGAEHGQLLVAWNRTRPWRHDDGRGGAGFGSLFIHLDKSLMPNGRDCQRGALGGHCGETGVLAVKRQPHAETLADVSTAVAEPREIQGQCHLLGRR
jgi:hypothetical protein